jgi:hypothetical protein
MKKLLFISFIFFSLFVNAQNFEYQVLFEGIGDNREYFSQIAMPQTILGARGAFEIGLEIDGHRLRGGLSEMYEFGSDIDFHKPELTLYYQFDRKQTAFLFGAFPRRNRIDFPLAMLTDTLNYYRPNIEGMFGQVNWDWGHQNGFVDWYSRQTETERESFMAGFSGEVYYKNLFIQNYLLLFHDAGPKIDIPGDHIKDYMGFAFQAGIRTSEKSIVHAYAKVGALGSSFRERSVTDGFINAVSFFAEAQGTYKKVGIKTVLSSGDGHRFVYGDRFYTQKNYLRTDAIWYFLNHEKVKGKFNYSFHVINWNDLDQQQQLSIIYVFGK